MKYPNGYLPKIEFYTKEIARLSKEMLYCHPKYVGGLSTQIVKYVKRLEYFTDRHCEEWGV
jgi:hypothetical protein